VVVQALESLALLIGVTIMANRRNKSINTRAKTLKVKSPRKPAATTNSRVKQANSPRKSDLLLTLLRAPGGASIKDLAEATGWQEHSVRGFLSGHIKKKLSLKIASHKGDDGTRRYHLSTS
jgi:hypothetical protein